MSDRQLTVYTPVIEEPVFPQFDEPAFAPEYLLMYRRLVKDMEAEAANIPSVKTAVGIVIRKLARDYVMGVIADNSGDLTARSHENDRRMLASLKLLLDQAAKADAAAEIKSEFALAVLQQVYRVIDSETREQQALNASIKESMIATMETFLEEYQEKIKGGR